MMNKAILFTTAAALAEQAMAFNSHRHLHAAQKRGIATDWVTVWDTVYVTAGEEPATSQAAFVADVPPASPTTTSTTVIVVPSSTPVATPTTHTTLVQSVKKSKHHKTKTTTTAAPVVVPTTTAAAVVVPTTSAIAIAEVVEPTTSSTSTTSTTSTTPVVVVQQSTSAAAAATTSAAVSTESTSSSSTGSLGFSKRGMAYNDASLANTFGSICSDCGWAYNWGSSSSGLDSGYSYVPMLWSDTSEHTATWDSDVASAISSGSKAILSFNEPDNAGQANLSPADAAAAHAQWLNPYAGQVLIGAPAISNSGNAGEGLEWLSSFFEACEAQSEGCQVDFCPIHWYSEAEYADTLFTQLESAHKICGDKPVWLTEFAPLGSDSDISSFLTTNLPKLDALDYLDAYSYFMIATGSIMSDDTSASDYGSIYASA